MVSRIKTEFQYLIDQLEVNPKDTEKALRIAELLVSKQISWHETSNKLRYYPKGQFKNKCIHCNTYYLKGEPCFYIEGKGGWHEKCASIEDKQDAYYLKCKQNEAKTEIKEFDAINEFKKYLD